MAYTQYNLGGGLNGVSDGRNYAKVVIRAGFGAILWSQIALTDAGGLIKAQGFTASEASYTQYALGSSLNAVSHFDQGRLKFALWCRGYAGYWATIRLPFYAINYGEGLPNPVDIEDEDAVEFNIPRNPDTVLIEDLDALEWDTGLHPISCMIEDEDVVEVDLLRMEVSDYDIIEIDATTITPVSVNIIDKDVVQFLIGLGEPVDCSTSDGELPPGGQELRNYVF